MQKNRFSLSKKRSKSTWMVAFLLLLAVCCSMCAPAFAQGDADKARLEAIRIQLQQLDAALKRSDLSSEQLTQLRNQVEPLATELRSFIAERAPHLDVAKARLAQLGALPAGSAPAAESVEVSTERQDQEKLAKDLDDILRIARFQNESATQLLGRIMERRRALFTSALFERTNPIFSPVLWLDTAKALPNELQHVGGLFAVWWDVAVNQLDLRRLGITLGFLLALLAGSRRLVVVIYRYEGRPDKVEDPSRLSRAVHAFKVAIGASIVPVSVCLVIYVFLDEIDILPDRVAPVLRNFLGGVGLIFVVRALGMGIAPFTKPKWRLFPMDDRKAMLFRSIAGSLAAMLAIVRTLEALTQAIVSPLSVVITIKGTAAVVVALLVIRFLRNIVAIEEPPVNEKDDYAELAALPSDRGGLLRIAGWIVAGLILAAAATGYIAFASFLSRQLTWVSMVLIVLALLVVLVDEAIDKGLSSDGVFGRKMRQSIGLKSASVNQISILTSGMLRLLLFFVAIFLILVPWGIDTSDLDNYIRPAFFGFSVAGVTISVSTIGTAMFIFATGLALTRVIKGWLDTRYLPLTGLDLGLCNSISTIFGYIGVILSLVVSFEQAGLSLERLTIVAGALSVGIGFGLQSIVNNFVSGLILLWERPLRVGDWIAVGGEEGIVKRINVRATEIETFDKASLIVPNSEFISGRVKNWVHLNRYARIIVPLSITNTTDPKRVEDLLVNVALANREVLSQPAPRVFFMKMADAALDFELRCFVDVDSMAATRSELMFAIHERLKEEGIEMPAAKPPMIAVSDLREIGSSFAAGISRPLAQSHREQASGKSAAE